MSIDVVNMGASALQIGYSSFHFLLENNQNFDVIHNKDYRYEVLKREHNTNISAVSILQIDLLRKKLEVKIGKLDCYILKDYLASIVSFIYKITNMFVVLLSMCTFVRILHYLSINLTEELSDVLLIYFRDLVISSRESLFNLIHIDNIKPYLNFRSFVFSVYLAWYTNQIINNEDIIDFIFVGLFYFLAEILNYANRSEGLFK